jgi:glycosyltransferase involved in cell wall biosynthesis
VRIGFDAKRAFHNASGLGNYSRDVLRILARHRPEHAYLAYNPRPARVPFAPAAAVEVRLPQTFLGRTFPAAWRQALILGDLRRDRIDLFHGLSAELPRGLARAGVPGVVTIHDLIFERMPELYAAVDRRIYRAKARRALAEARRVVAISEQTRRDLVELYGADPARVRVAYQGCHEAFQAPIPGDELERVTRERRLPSDFLLSVGTIERRKNLALAVGALRQLPAHVALVVVGRPTAYLREVEQVAVSAGVQDRLVRLERVDMRELAALYRLAIALVYPSRYEGFGIPIIEALFSGTPVVTSRGGCFEEAGGPGSAYVDPDDVDGFAAAVAGIVRDPDRREQMRAQGLAHARRFSDVAVAAALFGVYEEAVR